MDNLNKFPDNFFISKNLDRLSEHRTDDDWVKDKLINTQTFIIPLSNLKVLLSDNDRLKTVFLNPAFFNNLNDNQEHFIFLGSIEEKHYFCVNIEDIGLSQENLLLLGKFHELRVAAPLIEEENAGILGYARAMIYWHQNHRYCGKCGYPTQIKLAGHKRICSNQKCGKEHFPRTDPAIIVLVNHGDKCLLARQAHWREGQYATIAGFVEPGESLEQAVAREVFEETGIGLNKVWYRSSQPWPFPTSIMLGFRAESKNTEISLRDHELEDARWYSRDEIRNELKSGSLKLSPKVSISFRLIEEWFDQIQAGELLDLLNGLSSSYK